MTIVKGNISPLDSIRDQVIRAYRDANGNKSRTVRILREEGIETSLSSIRRALERWKIQSPEEFDLPSHLHQIQHPVLLNKKEIYDEDIAAWWENLQKQQEQHWKLSRFQDHVFINFEFDKPIGVAFLSDLHIGSEGTHYGYITDVMDAIVETDGLYVVFCGDTIDNMIWKRAGGNKELIRSSIQKILARDLMQEMFGKALAILQGCHENFSLEYDDFTLGEYLASHTMGAYLGDGGDIYMAVGDAPYHMHVRHKFKGESTLNIENAFRRMYDGPCAGKGFDVGVIGHMHYEPFVMHLTRGEGPHRRDVMYVRPGTAKIFDQWCRSKHGRFGAEFVVPMVVFYPKWKHMIGFKHLGIGINALNHLRETWDDYEGNETEIMD